MPTIRVVLVEPKNEGNVGAVARAMKNFGVADLVLVKPCRLGAEARQRAMRGIEIMEAARAVDDLETALRDADLIVGTSGIDTRSEKRFARISLTPRDFAARVAKMDGRVALVFGREDFGLLDEELRRCDLLTTIPASSDYPILNLSHAVTILLYELLAARAIKHGKREASGMRRRSSTRHSSHCSRKRIIRRTNDRARRSCSADSSAARSRASGSSMRSWA